ncbi:MAG: hypothetical protein WC896_02440 [Bacteroidales bacterium]
MAARLCRFDPGSGYKKKQAGKPAFFVPGRLPLVVGSSLSLFLSLRPPQRTAKGRVASPRIFGRPAIFGNSSSFRPVFEDEPAFFGNSSSKTPLFEDERLFFGNSSSKTPLFEEERLFFEDEPAIFGNLSTGFQRVNP